VPDSELPATEAVWTFVAPEDVVPPTSLVDARVQKGVSALQSWMREAPAALARWWTGAKEGAEVAEASSGAKAQPAPDALLERIAPVPDWSEAVVALDAALKPWIEEPDDVPALVLDAWYHGAPSIVRRWAEARGWTIVDPPSREDIAQPDAAADWLAARERSDTPWVLPHLERCHLRTPRGLAFVRALLDRWAEGALGRGLIGCDPHAWAYLRHVWPGQIPHRLTLHPFSADVLGRWFRALAEAGRPDGAASLSFRVAGEDNPVLPERHDAADDDGAARPPDEVPTSSYLRGLAVYSQGHPGIAWTLWRRSLLVPPDASPLKADDPSNRESEPEPTIWVRPWSDVEHPRRPSDFAQPDMFVLHALLLHGGLSADQLSPLLPTDWYAVRHRLQGLRTAGFVVQDGATWQLTPAGYPAACDILRREAYLPDPYNA
jgi:hypothetical protein